MISGKGVKIVAVVHTYHGLGHKEHIRQQDWNDLGNIWNVGRSGIMKIFWPNSITNQELHEIIKEIQSNSNVTKQAFHLQHSG